MKNKKQLNRIKEITKENQFCNIHLKVHEGEIEVMETTIKEKY